MSLRVGDSVFLPRGETAVVTDHDKKTSKFALSTSPEVKKQNTRHGYINGMSPDQRASLMALMDQVKELSDPNERVGQLRSKLEELKSDPTQWRMSRYVEAELAHTMNVFGIKPTTYSSELGVTKNDI